MDIVVQYFPRIFLAIISLAFVFFGVLGLVNPAGTVLPMDIAIQTAHAKTEIRATYGGLMLGIGLLLAYTAFDENAVRLGLIAVMCMLFTIGLTRLYGFAFDGTRVALQWQLLCLELGPAIIALLIFIFHSRVNPNSSLG